MLNWNIGVELELLAPTGLSRRDLAQALAEQRGGSVRRIFYPQAEPSKVPGQPVFESLTLGYQALDAQGQLIASCVDDLTLQNDLLKQTPPLPGWYRIVSDDVRFLRLIMQQCDPLAPLEQVLEPLADLFGSEAVLTPQGMLRVADNYGASIAIAAPLPGQRERPCELITPVLTTAQAEQLQFYLDTVNKLGFTAPIEGATHVHFDAAALAKPVVFANLVRLLRVFGPDLRRMLGTNPNCRRLGTWPEALHELVEQPDFLRLDWPQAQAVLQQLKLTKYCDFNLRNLVHSTPNKHTFEVRILPVYLELQPLLYAIALFESLLHWALAEANTLRPLPTDTDELLQSLPLADEAYDYWQRRIDQRV